MPSLPFFRNLSYPSHLPEPMTPCSGQEPCNIQHQSACLQHVAAAVAVSERLIGVMRSP